MSDLSTTRLLVQVRAGDRSAFDALYERVYESLREIARQRLRQHGSTPTLATTALVHEAYLRLIDQDHVGLQDRAHFNALSAQVMRSVLVDYARERSAQKRGGGQVPVPLDAIQLRADERAEDLLALDAALSELAALDERLGIVVEYRFFGGLNFDEIAEVTGRSVSTLKRDWRRARLWLHRMLQTDAGLESAL